MKKHDFDLYSMLENATTIDEDIFDIRFEEVVSLVDEEKLDEATTLITSIFNEGTVDIRLVMYLFYSQFISQGIGAIKNTFPAIKKLINDYWGKISPVNMREKYFLNSVTWFLSSIVKKLKRSEKLAKNKKNDAFTAKSLEKLTAQDIDQLVLITQELAELLTQKMEEPSLNQYIQFISKWLDNLKGAIGSEEKALQATPPIDTPTAKPSKQISLQEVLSSSEAMIRLFRKIQAFEELIAKENFEKAALISDDIALIIKNFDPSVFFPKLFSQYFALSAAHMDALSREWENKGSLKWDALNRLYQTDLEEFIQW